MGDEPAALKEIREQLDGILGTLDSFDILIHNHMTDYARAFEAYVRSEALERQLSGMGYADHKLPPRGEPLPARWGTSCPNRMGPRERTSVPFRA